MNIKVQQRYSPEQLKQSSINPPQTLDCLEFDFQQVTFRCYGILHGITGGLNREYIEFVKHSIILLEGCKLAEKGMKQLYANCGIDEELEDWMVLRPIDSLVLGFQLTFDPRCLWMITVDAIRERLRKTDPYIVNHRKNIIDLGESPYFHYLDEIERRELVGFLPSKQAIARDLKSMSKWYGSIWPTKRHIKIKHPQWHRLLLLERVMHIPCRSIHMLHFALAYAQQHKLKRVNLFVGETHNTDMHYLAHNLDSLKQSLDSDSLAVMQKIIKSALRYGKRNSFSENLKLIGKKINYLLFLVIGAAIPVSFYVTIYRWL